MGKVFRTARCKCGWNKNYNEPPAREPKCPKCGSNDTRYSYWRIQYKTATGNTETETLDGCSNVKLAREILSTREGAIAERRYLGRAEQVTYEEGRDLYLAWLTEATANGDIRPRTKEFYEQRIKILDEYFEGHILNDLNTYIIKEYTNQRRKVISERTGRKLTNSTINRELSTLSVMIGKLCDGSICRNKQPILSVNPIREMDKLSENKAKQQALEVEQMWHLIDCATTPQVKLFMQIGFFTGLRHSNILNFRWEQIDFKQHQITFESYEMKGKRTEVIEMPEYLENALTEYRKSLKVVYPHVLTSQCRGRNRKGQPYNNLDRPWLESCIAAGLYREQMNLKGEMVKVATFTPHGMKHTFVSLMDEANDDKRMVQAAAMHSSITTTERYTKVQQKRKRAAVAKFEEVAIRSRG